MRSCGIASQAAPALRGLLRVALTIAVGGNSVPIKLAAHLIKSLVLVSDDLSLVVIPDHDKVGATIKMLRHNLAIKLSE